MTSACLGALLGTGKNAEVFAYGVRVAKLYRAGVAEEVAAREARKLAFVKSLGLPTPAAYGVEQIDGRWAVIMDRVDGPPLAAGIEQNPAMLDSCLTEMASLHIQIHAKSAEQMPPLKERLDRNIGRAAALLGEARVDMLIAKLATLPDGDRLCHGDFHPFNIMGQPDSLVIVDWLDANCGDPAADVCRSYVLMRNWSPEFASAYVEAYARVSGESAEGIFAWLSVVAAARLAEGVPNEEHDLLAMVDLGVTVR